MHNIYPCNFYSFCDLAILQSMTVETQVEEDKRLSDADIEGLPNLAIQGDDNPTGVANLLKVRNNCIAEIAYQFFNKEYFMYLF